MRFPAIPPNPRVEAPVQSATLVTAARTGLWERIAGGRRADLLASGVLTGIEQIATEAGIRWPIALSPTLARDVRAIPAGRGHESWDGRVWDCLTMYRVGARMCPPKATEFRYTFFMTTRPFVPGEEDEDDGIERHAYRVLAILGPDDSGGPALTLFRDDEDERAETYPPAPRWAKGRAPGGMRENGGTP